MKDSITNTAAQSALDKLVASINIPAQEREGQAELVASSLLPLDLHRRESDFAALGFVFHGPVEDDPLFQRVTLPPGWQREGTSHAMWSYITDEQGRRRVALFYKAAFYDRGAHASLEPRFTVTAREGDDDPTYWLGRDNGTGALHDTGGTYEAAEAWVNERRGGRSYLAQWTEDERHALHGVRVAEWRP